MGLELVNIIKRILEQIDEERGRRDEGDGGPHERSLAEDPGAVRIPGKDQDQWHVDDDRAWIEDLARPYAEGDEGRPRDDGDDAPVCDVFGRGDDDGAHDRADEERERKRDK